MPQNKIMFNPYYALAQHFSFVSPTIYKSRFYKNLILLNRDNIFERNMEPELLWLRDFLPQKAVFCEIGCGWGHYLYWLDYQLFPENIHAFEPHKKLYKRGKNLFPKMNFYPMAVGLKSEIGTLHTPSKFKEEFPEKSTIYPIIDDDEDLKIATQKVEIISLDDWAVQRELLRLDLIKIDIPSSVFPILEGAKNTLQKYSPTLMIKMENSEWKDIQKVEEYGYQAHYLCRENWELKPLSEKFLYEYNSHIKEENERKIKNIIFIKH